jgi:ribonuclease HII
MPAWGGTMPEARPLHSNSKAACFPSLDFERSLWSDGYACVAGIDEAGRGALAGPVAAAAVILPAQLSIHEHLRGVRDSKLMTPEERELWAPRIQAAAAGWGIGFASAGEIDVMGILPATRLAAVRALANLTALPEGLMPDYLLTDYLVFSEIDLPQTALVKGDRLSLSVAAASVLAKTSRDCFMRTMDGEYPGYNFARHKGYGTAAHLRAIGQLGVCEIHRKSFSFTPILNENELPRPEKTSPVIIG